MPGSPRLAPAYRGAELRDAQRDRAVQELLHRTEYLAGVLSQVTSVEAPAGEGLPESLRASRLPHLVDSAASILCRSQQAAEGRIHTPTFFMGAPHRERAHLSAAALDMQEVQEGASAKILCTQSPEMTTSHGHEALKLQGVTEFHDTVTTIDRMLGTFDRLPPPAHRTTWGQKLQGPVETMKVKPAPPPAEAALCNDHAHANDAEWRRHAAHDGCNVQWLGKSSGFDATTPGLRFATHFFSRGEVVGDGAGCPGGRGVAGPSRFVRVDGGGESTTEKFSVMERGSTVVRPEGANPFHSHALVTAAEPLRIFREGHYFEIGIRSFAYISGVPERPRSHAPRSEGLIIGVTTAPPHQMDRFAHRAEHVAPDTWCLSMGGTFIYGGDASAVRPSRPTTQDCVIAQRPRWHPSANRPVSQPATSKPSELRRCIWPPPPSLCRGLPATTGVIADDTAVALGDASAEPGAGEATPCELAALGDAGADGVGGRPPLQRRLPWSTTLSIGDRVGVLVTPFGGFVLIVNGQQRLLIPDAGVASDTRLYPLVEVYNHFRSVQLHPNARPPR